MKFQTMAVALALAASGPLGAGELRGRAFLDEKPAQGVTLTAVPVEAAHETARREAREGGQPAALATAVTGADGGGVLTVAAKDGLVEVRVSAPGVVAYTLDGAWGANESDELPEIALTRSRAVSGRVVDAAGAPVEGADVELIAQIEESLGRAVPQHTKTASNGTFRFDGASVAGNTISVSKPGHAPVKLIAQKAGALSRPFVLGAPLPISGTVVLPSKKPAAGALVRFEGAGVTRWVEADAAGAFRIADAPRGAGQLVATAGPAGAQPGTGGASRAGAARIRLVLPATAETPLVVALEVPGTLEGRVVDAQTLAPVPGVRIETRSGGERSVTRTGKDGTYRIRGLSEGRYRVAADEPRYVRAVRIFVAVEAGVTRRLDVSLVRGAAISGRILSETGEPVSGAQGALVRLRMASMASTVFARIEKPDGSLRIFRTGTDGRYRLTRVAPGDSLMLAVFHRERERGRRNGLVLAPGETKTGVDVVLRRGLELGGSVVDPAGNPIVLAKVVLQTQEAGRQRGVPTILKSLETDAAGRFEARGLSPLAYEVVVTKPGTAAIGPVAVVLTEKEPVEPLRIVLEPGAGISGRVRSKDGAPIEGVVVVATGGTSGAGRPFRVGSAPTARDGAFEIEGLRPGQSYGLALFDGPSSWSGPDRTVRTVEAPAEAIELEGAGRGRIRGVAVDLETGRPLEEFSVSREDGSLPWNSGSFPKAYRGPGGDDTRIDVTAPDGAFELSEVPQGTWRIVVEAKGYQNGSANNVVVAAGELREGVEVKLARARSLTGQIADARTGRPVPAASVSAQPSAGNGGSSASYGHSGEPLASDADGRFEIPGLGPGSYTVVARHPDYSESREQAEVGDSGGTVRLRMSAGSELTGVVVAGDRTPLSSAEVFLEAGGRREFASGGGAGLPTDEAGRFRFAHLRPGSYTLRARDRGRTSPAVEAVVVEGESRGDLVLRLEPGAVIRVRVKGLAPGQRASVYVRASAGFSANLPTRDDGTLEIPDVAAGRVDLYATTLAGAGQPSRTVTKGVDVPPGAREVDVELVFEEGIVLSGRVLRGGNPASGAHVSAFGRGGRGGSATSDDAGEYRIEGLAKEATTVSVSLDSAWRSRRLALTGDQRLDLELGSARIEGAVLEEGRSRPLADVSLEAVLVADAGDSTKPVLTDTSGRFLIADLEAAATYRVRATKPGFATETLDVKAEAEGASARFELRRAEGVGLRARDGRSGVPLSNVYVRALSGGDAPAFSGTVLLDSEGRGEVPSLKPGRTTLVLGLFGYATVTLEGVSIPSTELDVRLTPGGVVEFRNGPETEARILAGAAASLAGADGRPHRVDPLSTGDIRLRGPVSRIGNLAPGSYVVKVEGGASRSFEVREGETTVVLLP